MMIDLHTHTSASDGSLDLAELVSQAKQAGLKAIAITDHDTIASASRITGKEQIETISGIELSVFDYGLGYMDVHILGLFIDPRSQHLQSELKRIAIARDDQKKATIEKLCSMGYEITFEEVKAKAKGSIGRPHIAKVLCEKRPNEFPGVQSVFDKLLGVGKPAYVDRQAGFSLKDAIDLIHNSGGLSFLAHPFIYECDIDKLVADFEHLDGDGIETYYDYITNRPEKQIKQAQNSEMIAHAQALAMLSGLLQSGGSDFHGENKGQTLGRFSAPDALLSKMKAALG